MTSIDSVYGKLSFLAPPPAFGNLDLPDESSLTPYGADAPERRIQLRLWPSRSDHDVQGTSTGKRNAVWNRSLSMVNS